MHNDSLGHRPKVGIFRLQMFKPSETFITMQASALSRYEPIHVGRRCFGQPQLSAQYIEFGRNPLVGALTMVTGGMRPASNAIRGRRLDLIHAHFAIDGVYALKLARDLSLPLVTTLHGFDVTTDNRSLLASGRPALVRYALGKAKLQQHGDLFICVSEFIRKKAIERGYPAARTVVHYIGNPNEYALQPVHAQPNPIPTIVHVARLVEKKGTRFLLDAVARLKAQGTACRVDLIGAGPLLSELQAQVVELGLNEVVCFHGALPHLEVLTLISKADVLALPSVTARDGDAEGLGMVLLEAAACGVPIVATRSGGIPEAVIDGETGILVAERDSDGLAEALHSLFSRPAILREMGAAARKFVKARFDLRAQTEALEEIYDDVRQRFQRSRL